MAVSGIICVIWACSRYDVWSPLFVFPALLISGLPVALAVSLSSPDNLSDPGASRSALELCYFTAGALVVSVVAIPLMLWHMEWIEKESVALTIGGSVLVLSAAGLYQIIFNRFDDEDSY